MAMAAKMPMIATTIISSMRVKPRWLPKLRRRVYQNRSIRSSLLFEFLPDCSHALPPLQGGALLGSRREGVRRSARLREADGNESKRGRLARTENGVAGVADRRCPGFSRVVDKDEPVENLIAVGLLVVLEPHDAASVEFQFGQPALREREEQQTAEQDRERQLLAASRRFHGIGSTVHFPRQETVHSFQGHRENLSPGNDV